MKREQESDPQRWQEEPPDEESVDADIGAVVRQLREPTAPGEQWLANTRQLILARAAAHHAARPIASVTRRRVPIWALAIGCMLLGSVATAVAGIAFFKYARPSTAPAVGSPGSGSTTHRRSGERRFHLSVRGPAAFELALDDGGAAVTMLDGAGPAELTGSTLADPIKLAPDVAWREGAGIVSRAEGPTPSTAPAAATPPSDRATPTGRTPDLPAAPPRPPRRPALEAPTVEAEASAVAPTALPPAAFPAPPAALVPQPRAEARRQPTGESQLVADALTALRTKRDPRGALLQLDERARLFPGGALAREADLVRVEALLALGDRTGALAALDRIELERREATSWPALVRAELRAAAGRCAEAQADFDGVVAMGTSDELGDRALYGRGACHLEAGEASNARSDFEAYLRRFPRGQRRAEVERVLAQLQP